MSEPKTYDAGEAGAVKKRKRATKIRDRQTGGYMQVVLQTLAGRAILWDLLEGCGVFNSSYRGDVHEMVYLEGQRKVGLTLIESINKADRSAYARMAGEAAAREYTHKQETGELDG